MLKTICHLSWKRAEKRDNIDLFPVSSCSHCCTSWFHL